MPFLITALVIALCIAMAGAATLNTNIVVSKPSLQIATTTAPPLATCPSGYDCMTEADAAAQLGTYAEYSDAVCGYKQNTATAVAVIRVPQYCVRKTTPPASCPDGCSCMPESAAKDKFQGNYKQCSDQPCNTAVTAAAQVNYYCFGPGTTMTTPAAACPAPCVCMATGTATEKWGANGYRQCGQTICGRAPTATAVIPYYCYSPLCPDGCTCISDADATLKGLTAKCDPNEQPCGYQSTAATANIQASRIPQYCYKTSITPVTPTSVCPDNCGGCMNEGDAKAKFGPFNYTRCSDKVCGYDQTATSAYAQPKYCFRPTGTITPAPQPCGEGCYCLQTAEADLKFGPGNYTRCKADPCGNDPSAASANGIPRYCFKPTGAPTPPVCPQGCVCTTDEIAKIKGLTPCRGTRTSCGYTSDQQPQYCFEQVPSPTCSYDYQKNVCAGTCPEGYSCGLLASQRDAAGNVAYAVCGCTGQPSGQCTFDSTKQTCAGTCQSGASCAIVGKKVDDKTGEVAVVCGCPQPSSDQCTYDKEKQACTGTCPTGAACSVIGQKTDDAGNVYVFCGCPQPSACVYDYSKESCAGTCPATGDACQINTIYRDPASGKVTYAECHCKGSGITQDTCAFNADHYCTGTCPQGGQCTNTSVTDASGKPTFACTCAGGGENPVSVAKPATNFLDTLFSIINKLLGGK